jgi:UMF1 family MFS transporter
MAAPSHRKRIWGWMMFDWASQPYYTLVLTFVFGPYFVSIASEAFLAQGLTEQTADARAQSMWSWGQTGASLVVAGLAPIIGAIADNSGRRMPWIAVFSLFYLVGTAMLWMTYPDGSTLVLALVGFGIAFIGAEFALIFVNSMLPGLGGPKEIGKISGNAYALGYAGGVFALFLMLLVIAEGENGKTLIGLDPAFGLVDPDQREGTRLVGPVTALWYLVFMIPFFLWVREPRIPGDPNGIRTALGNLGRTLRSLPQRRSLFAYLAGSMFYRDALAALYGFGGTYAVLVLDWSITQVGVFGIVGAITAGVFSWLGGKLDSRIGPKPVIVFCVLVLIGLCVVILSMSREAFFGMPLDPGSGLPDLVFYLCGATIGAAGGVLQSASRSLMVRHANPARPTEAFGIYALAGKATAFIGPFLIGAVVLATENARLGAVPLIALFILGLILLFWVDAEGDQPQAEAVPA